MQRHTAQQIAAVASRSGSRAAEFARQRGIAHAYGGYADLLGDPEVDIVYISTPHIQHRSDALAALAAGKHVLVEKPLGTDGRRRGQRTVLGDTDPHGVGTCR